MAEIHYNEGRGDDSHRGANEQHFFRTHAAHYPTANQSAAHEESQSAERQQRGGGMHVHPSVVHYIVDEKAVDGYFRDFIAEQGKNAERERKVLGKIGHLTGAYVAFAVSGVVAHFGQFDTGEDERYGKHHNACIHIGGRHARIFAEKEESADERRADAAQPVERLRQIQTAGCRRLVAQFRQVGIGRRFEESKAATDDKQGEKEKFERHNPFAGNEQQRTDAIEYQPENHAVTVSPAVDVESCRNSHREIARVEHHLNESGMGFRHDQCILEMLVEHIEDCMGKSPHKTQ